MEDELNYLSEKIEDLKVTRMKARQVLGEAIGSKGFKAQFNYLSKVQNYNSMTLIIRGYSVEIDILNNILAALTIRVVETQKVNKRVEKLDKNINWD